MAFPVCTQCHMSSDGTTGSSLFVRAGDDPPGPQVVARTAHAQQFGQPDQLHAPCSARSAIQRPGGGVFGAADSVDLLTGMRGSRSVCKQFQPNCRSQRGSRAKRESRSGAEGEESGRLAGIGAVMPATAGWRGHEGRTGARPGADLGRRTRCCRGDRLGTPAMNSSPYPGSESLLR